MRCWLIVLLLVCGGCASRTEPTDQERTDYPVSSWMMDQMWWVPGFMKHPRGAE
jgi:hypothetical protein